MGNISFKPSHWFAGLDHTLLLFSPLMNHEIVQSARWNPKGLWAEEQVVPIFSSSSARSFCLPGRCPRMSPIPMGQWRFLGSRDFFWGWTRKNWGHFSKDVNFTREKVDLRSRISLTMPKTGSFNQIKRHKGGSDHEHAIAADTMWFDQRNSRCRQKTVVYGLVNKHSNGKIPFDFSFALNDFPTN